MKSLLSAALLCWIAAARAAPVSIEPADVDAAIALATLLDARQGQPVPPGANWFAELPGTQAVIVTAPHATRPFRDGHFRFADGGGTGALAAALHRLCGVTVLHTVYDSPSDPNFSDDNDFKRRLGELIAERRPALLLDIHGSHPHRPYDVDLGTMNGRSVAADPTIVPQLTGALRAAGLMNVSDNRFPAAVQRTVTRFAHARGVSAVQLEFSTTRTEPQQSRLQAHLFAQGLEALAKFLAARGQCVAATMPAVAPAAAEEP